MMKYAIEITSILPIFLKTVDFLVKTNVKGRSLVAPNADQSMLNFKVISFKTALKQNVDVPEGEEKDGYIKSYLQVFRDLGLIVSNTNRLTNIGWIDGKSMRVITVKKDVYETLLKLKNDEKSGKEKR